MAAMCNLYSMIRNQEAIRRLFGLRRDATGNLPSLPAIYPDGLAPIVRAGRDGTRELIMMRWGFPPPPNPERAQQKWTPVLRLDTRQDDRPEPDDDSQKSHPVLRGAPVTNIRNAGSPYWRAWLGAPFRCLVPATSFCEWTETRPKIAHWFALAEDRPLFAFAGLWRPWTGTRGPKAAPVAGEHLLFSVLTTEANEIVRPVHAKAMPVMLTDEAAWQTWLEAPAEQALALQRPLPADALKIVAKGNRTDGAVGA
jgi:putative SOS response-associated peptidase YedK